MKVVKLFVVVLVFLSTLAIVPDAYSQCAMCTMNAENSVQHGNTQGKGLNNGILYLLAAPYLAVAAVGFLWYKKYRRKNVNIHIRDEKINLN
ncbi:hypothetical protein [Desertivirga arenae]|uniref:hypothetical protein n=1 Tax=Desertivirga arenae TaxID=2810309 RepID=UPI001A96BD67|nr:hypothetical protein [Pedobacter sp. SYSU D00823]